MILDSEGRPPGLAWLQALREPNVALSWPLAEWERALRLARRLRLLARLAEGLLASGLMDSVPSQPRRHLVAEHRLSRWRTSAMLWALERVTTMLREAPYPCVLLKGAAYIGQDLPIAAGRLPADLDVLVPRVHLPDALARLTRGGWNVAKLDEHDRRYYHEWSHEVPPMRHPMLVMELDLHHGILPPVARTNVDTDVLLQRLRPSKWARWQVLDPADQVLHGAAHLFLDSEVRDRIRDLVDLDGLLRYFGQTPDFINQLPGRAQQLGLEEPLALALHFCASWFGTPIPAQVMTASRAIGLDGLRRASLIPLFERVLLPAEPDQASPPLQGAAAFTLRARYHLNRMPIRLLVPHLWHKARSGRHGRTVS